MIGNYDKKRKEQKALLKELESIKSLLDDGELIDDDYSDLAATAIKKSSPEMPASDADDDMLIHDDAELSELIDDEDDDFLISDELEIDLSQEQQPAAKHNELNIPILEEMVEDDSAPLAPGVLPGQQSLFNEGKQEAKTAPNNKTNNKTNDKTNKHTQKRDTANKQKTVEQTPAQKQAQTENPFLPKHIRERLSGTVDIPAYAQPNEVVRSPYVAPKFSYDDRTTEHPPETKPKHTEAAASEKAKELNFSPSASLYEPISNDIDQQDMIDALVNEFMPKIESRLRLRLAKALDKASKK